MHNIIVGKLEKLFSAVTKPRRPSGSVNWLPARDFETQAGISGISGHYVFPHGLSAAEYERRYFDAYRSKYDAPIKNQNLTQIELDNWNKNPQCDPALM